MEFTVQCPSCKVTLKLRDESLLGKAIRCPRCRKAIKLPATVGSKSSPRTASSPGTRSKRSSPPPDQIEETWDSIPDESGEEYDDESEPSVENEFDAELLDFSDRTENTFVDPYSAPNSLPPRRSTKTGKAKPVEQPDRPQRPFPWMIVVSAVAAVSLIGLLIPVVFLIKGAITAASNASDLQQIRTNLKQIGLSFHNFHDTFQEFPIGQFTKRQHPEWFDKQGKPLLSWRVHVLPFIEQESLYEEFHLDEPWDSEHNKSLLTRMPNIYKNGHGQTKPGETCLQTPSGKGTVMEDGLACRLRDIADGASNTVMVVVTAANRAVPWTKPSDYDVPLDEASTGLYFANDRTVILLCDGATHFVARNSASRENGKGSEASIMSALFSRAGNEVIGEY